MTALNFVRPIFDLQIVVAESTDLLSKVAQIMVISVGIDFEWDSTNSDFVEENSELVMTMEEFVKTNFETVRATLRICDDYL